MLIQCPSCGTQAKIPDSKEGAKVRCPACQHVFVARPIGAPRARASSDPTKYFIYGGAALVALVVAVIATRGSEETQYAPEVAAAEEPEPEPVVDALGWDGPIVSLSRQLHAAAYSRNETKLLSKLDEEAAYARFLETAEVAEGEEPPVAWSALSEGERVKWTDDYIDGLLADGADGAVLGWEPFDGSVQSLADGEALVHLRVTARDASLGLDDRWTAWTLRNLDGESGSEDRWRWVHVERFLTPEELAALRRGTRKKTERKTLSDGSVVYESDIRAIPFDEGVPAEEQERLNSLVDRFVADLDAPPRERTAISRELVDAGKVAIAPLLTKIASITEAMPDDMTQSPDDLNRIFFLHNTLREITGVETTFDVSVEMGATKERILSGVKQWYGWYDRKYRKFEGREIDANPLADDPDFQPQTPEEERRYRRDLEEQLKAERAKQDG